MHFAFPRIVMMRIVGPPSRRSSVVLTFEPAGICTTPSHAGHRYRSASTNTSGLRVKASRTHAGGQRVRVEESRRTFVGVSDDFMAPSCSFVALSALERGG